MTGEALIWGLLWTWQRIEIDEPGVEDYTRYGHGVLGNCVFELTMTIPKAVIELSVAGVAARLRERIKCTVRPRAGVPTMAETVRQNELDAVRAALDRDPLSVAAVRLAPPAERLLASHSNGRLARVIAWRAAHQALESRAKRTF